MLKKQAFFNIFIVYVKKVTDELINQLVNIGLLEYEKVGRESIYKNIRLINLLSKF